MIDGRASIDIRQDGWEAGRETDKPRSTSPDFPAHEFVTSFFPYAKGRTISFHPRPGDVGRAERVIVSLAKNQNPIMK
jgi:hypothetical protein